MPYWKPKAKKPRYPMQDKKVKRYHRKKQQLHEKQNQEKEVSENGEVR